MDPLFIVINKNCGIWDDLFSASKVGHARKHLRTIRLAYQHTHLLHFEV